MSLLSPEGKLLYIEHIVFIVGANGVFKNLLGRQLIQTLIQANGFGNPELHNIPNTVLDNSDSKTEDNNFMHDNAVSCYQGCITDCESIIVYIIGDSKNYADIVQSIYKTNGLTDNNSSKDSINTAVRECAVTLHGIIVADAAEPGMAFSITKYWLDVFSFRNLPPRITKTQQLPVETHPFRTQLESLALILLNNIHFTKAIAPNKRRVFGSVIRYFMLGADGVILTHDMTSLMLSRNDNCNAAAEKTQETDELDDITKARRQFSTLVKYLAYVIIHSSLTDNKELTNIELNEKWRIPSLIVDSENTIKAIPQGTDSVELIGYPPFKNLEKENMQRLQDLRNAPPDGREAIRLSVFKEYFKQWHEVATKVLIPERSDLTDNINTEDAINKAASQISTIDDYLAFIQGVGKTRGMEEIDELVKELNRK